MPTDTQFLEFDVLRYVGMITREVQTREYEGRPARVIVAKNQYDSTIDDVWDAITNPERIPCWFMPISGDLRPGGRYELKCNASGEITACEPPRMFDITWEYGGDVSWVHVRLTERADGGTSLRLEHIAYVPDDHWDQYGPGAVGVGWDLSLVGLKRHLETGTSVDHEKAEQWTLTKDGKDFVTHSSDEWSRASIEAGTPEASAREAAGRTTAFYTGQV